MIDLELGCPQDINRDPTWSDNLNTPISKKPPPGKLFTIYIIYFSVTSPLHFSFFFNVVVQDRLAASIDLWQACAYRFTE
jgi:hypothetical protein